MIQTLLSVALGGALGATARFLVTLGGQRLLGPGVPFATLAINVAGSFAMGVLATLIAGRTLPAALAPFLLTGVLGGFTTFSAFSLDALALVQRGQPAAALAYVGGSVILSLAAVVAGVSFARGIA